MLWSTGSGTSKKVWLLTKHSAALQNKEHIKKIHGREI